jgi:hypothetical protein
MPVAHGHDILLAVGAVDEPFTLKWFGAVLGVIPLGIPVFSRSQVKRFRHYMVLATH